MDIEETFEGMETAVCPLCGGEAEWGFLDDDQTRVEVICRDCGRFEAPKTSFDDAQSDRVSPDPDGQ